MFKLRRQYIDLFQLDVDRMLLTKPCDTAKVFENIFNLLVVVFFYDVFLC
jgi:hypothetical protein